MAGDEATEVADVLVVEDNRTNRMLLVRGVEQEGHRVSAAADGRQALELLRSQSVDTVLLDLEMPEVDGFEVLATMQREPGLHEVPVVVISAVEDTEQVARAIELGALDVLPKPFDPVLLRARLRTGLQQRRLRRLEQAYLRQELALRQQEKLATLGRLSAGLAHELNNPAAAAVRTAHRLEDLLDRAEQVNRAVWTPNLDQLIEGDVVVADRAEREEALEEVLSAVGTDRAWAVAADLAAAGIPAEGLRAALGGLERDGARLAVEQLAVRVAVRAAVTQIGDSVGRISSIIGALRSYANLDRAQLHLVDVRRGLDDTLAMLHHKTPAGVEVQREYADELPLVEAHGGQLNQVWTNLIDNALHAVGPTGRIVVRAAAEGSGLAVQVEDDGPGVPEGLQGKVFDPFVTTKEPGEGTGLGLNIVHQIVTEGHQGRILVDSRPGRTVFTVQLPLQRTGADRPNE